MKRKKRVLADYIAKYGSFPCGRRVLPDGSNAQFKRDYDRQGRPVLSVRCLHCNREQAKAAMARRRRAAAAEARG